MGCVYKAADLKLGRTVALKFLPPQLAGSVERERFLQEARTASALDHPNLGAVHAIEETDSGEIYIVMSYYDGETLSEKIQRGPLPPAQAVDIALQTAQGLAEAHARGIVHRDIKSSNILVTRQGVVKILDFGLAKMAGARALTQTGNTVGTAAYMSPEQAEGRPIDHRTDLWSLGVVLYEMLSGRLPFQGESAASTLLAIVSQPPPELEHTDPALRAAIDRCLAKRTSDRYQNARGLIEALSNVFVTGDSPTRTMAVRPVQAGPALGWRWVALAVSLLILAALAFRLARSPGGLPSVSEKRVAVLPFSNVGNNPGNAAICDGLQETLTSRLTSLEQSGTALWVVPAVEVRRQRINDPAEAWRALHVNLVVTGSVQRSAGGVRLTVNLVDTETLRQVGSALLDDPLGNLSSVQDLALTNLARLLAVELNPHALGRASGDAAAAPAYESYLKGLSYLQRFDRPGNLDTAIQMFQDAVQADPSFALAYARLADALWTKHKSDPDPKLVDQALANGRHAAQINAQLSPVRVILGRLEAGTGKYDLAIQEFQRALELDPRSAEAWQQIATAYESLGRPSDAEASIRKAIALRPDNWAGYNALGGFFLRAERYPEAADAYQKVLDLTPDNPVGYSNLGVVLKCMQDRVGARRMYEKAIALNPSYFAYTNLAVLYYADGDFEKAASTYEQALALNDRDYRPWTGLAGAYKAMGRTEKFRTASRRALELAEAESGRDPNNPEIQGAVAYSSALLGKRSEALRRIANALALAPDSHDVLYQASLVYLALGERPAALRYLSNALARGYAKERVRQDPDWRNLRNVPEFQNLIR
jgi:serine/threonine-protein kinase